MVRSAKEESESVTVDKEGCLALIKYADRWEVEDPVLDCAIFIVDMMHYRQINQSDELPLN